MAAPAQLACCRLCWELLTTKDRRSIFRESFTFDSQLTQVIDYVATANDSKSAYVCQRCFNKLKKLSKIEFEISHKVAELQCQRHELLAHLRRFHQQGPCKEGKNRPIMTNSPILRRVKVPGGFDMLEGVRRVRELPQTSQASTKIRPILPKKSFCREISQAGPEPAPVLEKDMTSGKVKVTENKRVEARELQPVALYVNQKFNPLKSSYQQHLDQTALQTEQNDEMTLKHVIKQEPEEMDSEYGLQDPD